MNRQYKTQTNEFGTVFWYEENGEMVSFTETPGNRHYEEYLEWVEAGGVAEVIES